MRRNAPCRLPIAGSHQNRNGQEAEAYEDWQVTITRRGLRAPLLESRAYGTAKLYDWATRSRDQSPNRRLAVDRTEHDIDRADQRHDVRQHRTLRNMRQDAEIDEVWCANPEAIRQRRPIRHEVVTV